MAGALQALQLDARFTSTGRSQLRSHVRRADGKLEGGTPSPSRGTAGAGIAIGAGRLGPE